MEQSIRLVVPSGTGLVGALGILAAWAFGGVALADWRPDLWLVPIAVAPVVLLLAGVVLVTRRVLTADADGLSVRTEPFPMPGDRWIARDEIAVVSIASYEHDTAAQRRRRGWFASSEPQLRWAVVVVHPDHGTTWIAQGYPTATTAKDTADALRTALHA